MDKGAIFLFWLSLFLNSSTAAAQVEKTSPLVDPKTRPMGVNLFHSEEIRKKSLNVLIFISPDCPQVERYAETMRRLQVEFGSRSFAWFLVLPDRKHKRKDIVRYLNRFRLERFTIIQDPDFLLTRQFAVLRYPECVLISQKGELLYQGSIDDRLQFSGKWNRTAQREYLKEAMLAVLFQKMEYDKKTDAQGCLIPVSDQSVESKPDPNE